MPMNSDGRGTQIVLCGLGGQGILFATRVLAEAAIAEGHEVIATEVHGMAQRGGAVESHVKIGPFAGPLVRRGRADAAIAFDASRADAALAYVKPGGPCFVAAEDAPAGTRACDASAIARQHGVSRGANLVLLAFASVSAPQAFPSEKALLEAVERATPASSLETNRRAWAAGRGIA